MAPFLACVGWLLHVRRARPGEIDTGAFARRACPHGELLQIGSGLAAPIADQLSGAVRVRLTDAGRRRLGRAGPGALIRLTGRAFQEGSQAVLTDVASLRTRRGRGR